MKISPRCFHAACTIYGASTTLFLRPYPDSRRLQSRYAYFEHVQNKRSESVELPDHEDPAAIILRLWRLHYVSPAISHDRPRFWPIFDRSRSGVYVWTGGKGGIGHLYRADYLSPKHSYAYLRKISNIVSLHSNSLFCIFKDFLKDFLENFLKNYFSIEINEWIYKYCTHLIAYIIMIWRTRKTKFYSYFILFLG